ncbi:hypothetical protein [Dongia sp.]|uniref:hypothetical protein n=1 Tax=Dongia sp. TaxID=1977262 RepID=UPI0035AD7D9B
MPRQDLSAEHAALIVGAVDFCQQVTNRLRELTHRVHEYTQHSGGHQQLLDLLEEALGGAAVNTSLLREIIAIAVSRAAFAPRYLQAMSAQLSVIPSPAGGNTASLAVARARTLSLADCVKLLVAESLASSYRIKLQNDRLEDALHHASLSARQAQCGA